MNASKFFSRADVGMIAPDRMPGRFAAVHGTGLHWGGDEDGGPRKSDDCSMCAERWASYANFHINTRGWADIAYHLGYCVHGNVFEGRDLSWYAGAHGDTAANRSYIAVCRIGAANSGGPNAKSGALAAISRAQKVWPRAGQKVRPHSYWQSGTMCPGPTTRAWINKGLPDPKKEDRLDEDEVAAIAREQADQAIVDAFGLEEAHQGAHLTRTHRYVRDNIITPIEVDMDSTTSTAMKACVAMLREGRARGWHVDTGRFAENRDYTEDDL